ncbi:MAG: ATP-binding protein [Elstera sp.]
MPQTAEAISPGLSVRAKLLLAFSGSSLLTLAIAGIGWVALTQAERVTDQLSQQALPVMSAAVALADASAGLAAVAPVVVTAETELRLATIADELAERSRDLNRSVETFFAADSQTPTPSGPWRDHISATALTLSQELRSLVKARRQALDLRLRMLHQKDLYTTAKSGLALWQARLVQSASGLSGTTPQKDPGAAVLALGLAAEEAGRLVNTTLSAFAVDQLADIEQAEAAYVSSSVALTVRVARLIDLGFEPQALEQAFGALTATHTEIFDLRRETILIEQIVGQTLARAARQSAALIEQVSALSQSVQVRARSDSAAAITAQRSSKISMLLLGAGCALLAAIACFTLVQRFSRRLHAITAAMAQLAGGDRTTPVPAIRRSDEIGRLARAFSVFRDQAQERVELLEKVSEQSHLVRALFDNLDEGLAIFTPGGRLLHTNPRLAELLHLPEPPEAGTQARALLAASIERTARLCNSGRQLILEQDILDHPITSPGRWELTFPSGSAGVSSEPIVELRWTPLPSADFAILSCTDVSDRRSIERQLRQAQKMEAIGRFTGVIAHDFNNFLTAILTNLHLLAESDTKPEMRQRVQRALDAAERGAGMIARLLVFARNQALQPELLSVNDLILGMVDFLELSVGPEIAISLDLAPDLGQTLVDAGQLESALVNLVLNARDAMPGGGQIRICTQILAPDGLKAHQNWLCLGVEDSGSGMAPDVMARACDPFFTTKPPGEGTGLGLSMVYGFIGQSGGDMHIQSEPQRGTSVNLFLPRRQGTPKTARPAPEAVPPAPRPALTILLVDDDAAVRDALGDMLGHLGHRVRACATEAEALALLETEAIDLLLTDILLADKQTGWQIIRAARRRKPGLPVLVCTGYDPSPELGQGTEFAGLPVLRKPFTLPRLSLALATTGAGR